MARVFISHRTSDSHAATRLASALEEAGHEVLLDVAELRVGDSISGWMNTALGESDAVVLCYSPTGVEAPWIAREWLSALARQLNGDGLLLLPLRLPGSTPPPLLADLRYADASSDWDQAISELDHALQRISGSDPVPRTR